MRFIVRVNATELSKNTEYGGPTSLFNMYMYKKKPEFLWSGADLGFLLLTSQ